MTTGDNMKDTFNGWNDVGTYQIDSVMDYILTGRKAADAKFDSWLLPFIGPLDQSQKILDFGCGIGRNTFGLANTSPNWNVTGYDNEYMIGRKEEYYQLHYTLPIPPNVVFSSNWEMIKIQKFDVIVCSLVLQHIYEDALAVYVQDFKTMTKKLLVVGRRYNDEHRHSTWDLLQEYGLVPTEFYSGHQKIPFSAEGDPNDHHLAIYML
jgi:2-polyprenyl-3-methyl-5-hydroxy-6-metoxy-1,4-benzoquinol methylase